MPTALAAGGFFLLALVLLGLGLLGRRDASRGLRPDLLPDDLREQLGLWRDPNPGEGGVRAEDAFLSPAFRNSRSVALNFALAAVAAGAGVAVLIGAVVAR